MIYQLNQIIAFEEIILTIIVIGIIVTVVLNIALFLAWIDFVREINRSKRDPMSDHM